MVNNNFITLGVITLSTLLASAAPLPLPSLQPEPVLGNLLGASGNLGTLRPGHKYGKSGKSKFKGLADLPLLRGSRPILNKKNLLGPVEDILGGSSSGSILGSGIGSGSGSGPGLELGLEEDILGPVTGPITGPVNGVTRPLGVVLGVDVDLLTPTDLLCAKVDGIFLEQAYALGCVCLGQDGLLLTAEAGAHVVDGLIDWVKAKVDVNGFKSQYPEYGIPTCEHRADDDGGEFRCPLGKERKNGASPLSTVRDRSTSTKPSGSPSSTPTPSNKVVINSVAPAPSSTPAHIPNSTPNSNPSSGTGSMIPGPAPAMPPTTTTNNNNNDGPVNLASTPVDDGDGEDLPYCDELDGSDPGSDADSEAEAQEYGADGNVDNGDGEWVAVQSITSTETITIPATAYIRQETVTQTVTSTSTSTVTSTMTTTSIQTQTMTETKTETVTETKYDCQQSIAAAAFAPAPAPAPASGPAPSAAPAPALAAASSSPSPSPIAVASFAPTPAPAPSASASASPASAPASEPTPTPEVAAANPSSSSGSGSGSGSGPSSTASDDDFTPPKVAKLNGFPKPKPTCPPGEVMGATRCCPVDMIERDGDCGCNDGYQKDLLLNICVEICLPPLQLVDGKCLDLGLSVATDLVDELTDNLGLTNGSGIGNIVGDGIGNADGILGLGLGGLL